LQEVRDSFHRRRSAIGIARTGKWFASEHFGLEPDLLVSAKSLGGGMPLAAVTGRAEVMDAPGVGGLGGTFGGNRFPVWQRWPLLKRSRKKDCLHVRPKLGSDLKCEHAAGRKSGNLSAKCAAWRHVRD